jgi:hypothetical protein
VNIPALRVPAGLALVTVISDNDDYDAVLPLSVVRSVAIYQEQRALSPAQPASAAAIVAAALAPRGGARQSPALAPTGLAAISTGGGAPAPAGSGPGAVAQGPTSGAKSGAAGGGGARAPSPAAAAESAQRHAPAGATGLVSVPAASASMSGR